MYHGSGVIHAEASVPSVDLSSTGGRLLQDRQFRLPTLLLLAGLLALAILALGASPAEAATIVVTTTSDAVTSGDGCSLREAIVNANADQQTNTDCAAGSGTDTITFNIPANADPGCNVGTGICTITPSAGSIVFPPITAPVVIDGYT